jgi:hypothetical protein
MVRKLILLSCGLVAAAYSVPAAWLNGLAIGRGGGASYVIAVAMVGVVIVSLVLGPVALECLRTGDQTRGLMLAAAWAVTFPLVLANSVGFTATNRTESVGSKEAAIEKYQRASAERDRLMSDLQVAQKSPRWEQTAGCTSNRSKRASRDFCDRVDEMRNGIQVANAVLNAGRPAAADAIADTLSWVTGLTPATIARLMPIWTVAAVEVAASAALMGAFAPAAPAASEKKPAKRRVRHRLHRKVRPAEPKPALKLVR